jgi:hypothetical protein
MKRSNHSDRIPPGPITKSRYCGTRTRLPIEDYVVREKYLRRVRSLLEDPSGTDSARKVLYGIVNVGEDDDEIWIEKGLSESEKRFVVVHELVHARRQLSGEDFPDEALEEKIVELEAIARTNAEILDGIPNGLAFRLLHDFLTARGSIRQNTLDGLGKIHARIGILLGVKKTTVCDVPRWAA